jgi:membrane-associated phospholipid phosphatase
MIFITDFADEAVVLPLATAVGLALLLIGWRRGALAWSVVVGGTLATTLAIKILSLACGPHQLRSPSGHTAAAAVVYGGLAFIAAQGDRPLIAQIAAVAAALLIGASRLALGMHTALEVVLGATVGYVGVLALGRLAEGPPSDLNLRWALPPALLVLLIFHGMHWNVEYEIRQLAMRTAHQLHVCRGVRTPESRVAGP